LFVENVENGPARGGRRGDILRVAMLFAIAFFSRRRERARSSLLSSLSYFEFLCSDLLTLFPFFLYLSPSVKLKPKIGHFRVAAAALAHFR
jgi:hypothetical protein